MGAKPVRLEQRFVEARGTRMRYFVGGEGPPLVLVHGFTGAVANWLELTELLGRRYRVIVPELPGHGGSSPLPAAPCFDAFADRVRLVVAHEDALPAAFVGHSMGGLVALRLAVRHPDDVTALVLAASAGISSTSRWAEFWVAVFSHTRPAKAVAPFRRLMARYPRLRAPVFSRWEVADPHSLSPRMVEGFLSAVRLHTDVMSAGEALVRDDPRPDLDRVRCPALVIWGARDLQVPIGDAFDFARRLGAPLRTIADCGHLLIGERPAAVADAIDSFLRPGSGAPRTPTRARTPLPAAR
jgi:pimeloyl-ACP methyl ester carboxylesterase